MTGGITYFSPPVANATEKQAHALSGLQGFGGVPRSSRNAFPIPKSRYQANEIKRRQRKLGQFGELVSSGLSKIEAARKLRVGVTSIWRWQQQLEPQTANCGRISTFERFNVPQAIVERVQRLQLSGRSNAAAWKVIAADPDCPEELARFLRERSTIPDSFLKASRLERIRTTAVRAGKFLYIEQKERNRPML